MSDVMPGQKTESSARAVIEVHLMGGVQSGQYTRLERSRHKDAMLVENDTITFREDYLSEIADGHTYSPRVPMFESGQITRLAEFSKLWVIDSTNVDNIIASKRLNFTEETQSHEFLSQFCNYYRTKNWNNILLSAVDNYADIER
eukprot:gene2907-3359_t